MKKTNRVAEMAPQVLQLQEVEPPAELSAALSADFLGRLNIANPPPVRIATPPEAAAWGGYCSAAEYSEMGEVVIADWRTTSEWLVQQRIQAIYVHEAAHRLLSLFAKIESHGVEFFCLLLFLLRRAGTQKGERPWLISAGLYDCQDALNERGFAGIPSSGEAVDFSLEVALELAGQEITAEAAAQEICRRAKVWREEIATAPGRRDAAQKAAREKHEALQAALAAARDKIFWWRLYCAASSFLAALIFFLAISMR